MPGGGCRRRHGRPQPPRGSRAAGRRADRLAHRRVRADGSGSLPTVARRVSSSPDAYVYLAESIRAWPDQAALAGRIQDTGWNDVAWRNLTGGVVALHRARRR